MDREKVIIVFKATSKNINVDIEVPLKITAMELVVGLNKAYELGINTADIKSCYLACENPIALVRGDKTLAELGVRNGSTIYYTK